MGKKINLSLLMPGFLFLCLPFWGMAQTEGKISTQKDCYTKLERCQVKLDKLKIMLSKVSAKKEKLATRYYKLYKELHKYQDIAAKMKFLRQQLRQCERKLDRLIAAKESDIPPIALLTRSRDGRTTAIAQHPEAMEWYRRSDWVKVENHFNKCFKRWEEFDKLARKFAEAPNLIKLLKKELKKLKKKRGILDKQYRKLLKTTLNQQAKCAKIRKKCEKIK